MVSGSYWLVDVLRMTEQLACDGMQMALWRPKLLQDVIINTGSGGQYCPADYQTLGSMSAKMCCHDNACA